MSLLNYLTILTITYYWKGRDCSTQTRNSILAWWALKQRSLFTSMQRTPLLSSSNSRIRWWRWGILLIRTALPPEKSGKIADLSTHDELPHEKELKQVRSFCKPYLLYYFIPPSDHRFLLSACNFSRQEDQIRNYNAINFHARNCFDISPSLIQYTETECFTLFHISLDKEKDRCFSFC